ncbi:MAG: SH3 domain-containing protein [Spirochaetota bacterium]|nr:SH3 domain-containing protein [Spirochaetota bacterium]
MISISCNYNTERNTSPTPVSQKKGLILIDKSALRVDPFIYSSLIDQLNLGDIVEIVEASKEKSWIGKSEDYWYKVRLFNGIVGWTYGKNIRIFSGNSDKIIDEFLLSFWEKESKKLKSELAGTWWSINSQGDFTEHCLEIYRNGEYISYRKGDEKIAGDYNFSFKDNEIIFLNGTSFGYNLNYLQRGKEYYLKKILRRGELKFRRISRR